MFDLRVILPATPSMIRAWLMSLVDQVLPIDPDPAGWGQPQLSAHGFSTDVTLRPQWAPPEVEAAGGICVGLEMAFSVGNDELQPMGPGMVILVVPMGRERSEFRMFFPLGITQESRRRVYDAMKSAWPSESFFRDDIPFWMVRDFDRRKLFEAIATRGTPPPGAPPRRRRDDPLPWRSAPIQATLVAAESASTEEPEAAPAASSRVRKILFDANLRLRDDPNYTGRVRVTVVDLAKAAGYTRPYLYQIKGDIDLKPYLELKVDVPPER
jgi:hypothetical protein